MREKNLIKLFIQFSIYCLALLLLRVWLTDTFAYIFLVWNLFLAYIPFVISFLIKERFENAYLFYPLLFAWLFFLPNAPYIITDIFHLRNGTNMPQWFDLLLVISFAMNGVFVFFISLYDIYNVLVKKFSRMIANISINVVVFLTGFGIYLGRFLRWNTWDIITRPDLLFLDVLDRFLQPTLHTKTWGVTIGYSIFLFFGFQFVKLLNSNQQDKIELK